MLPMTLPQDQRSIPSFGESTEALRDPWNGDANLERSLWGHSIWFDQRYGCWALRQPKSGSHQRRYRAVGEGHLHVPHGLFLCVAGWKICRHSHLVRSADENLLGTLKSGFGRALPYWKIATVRFVSGVSQCIQVGWIDCTNLLR